MGKANSKYFYTASLMDEALLALLEKKEYDYITVKEICAKAGVNRSTFYLHYESIDDLLRESLAALSAQFRAKFQGEPLKDVYLITPAYILPYLEFLAENRRIFLTAVEKPEIFGVTMQFDDAYAQVLAPILERYGVKEEERKYVLAYYLSGMHALIIQWIKGGCRESPQYIAELLVKYTPGEKPGT